VTPSQALRPRSPRTWISLVRLSRPRYLSIQLVPFLIGAIATPLGAPWYLVFGVLGVLAWKVIVSIANIISDRAEDAIDHPERTVLVDTVGIRMLNQLLSLTCLLYVVLVALMVLVSRTPADTVLLWTFFGVAALAYSFLGVKRKTVVSPALFGAESAGFLWVGWHGGGGFLDWMQDIHLQSLVELDVGRCLTGDGRLIIPSVLVLWIFGATLCWSKDAPNLEGDMAVGYRSMYWQVVRGAHPYARALAVMSIPYMFVLLFHLYGYGAPDILVLAVYPVAVGFAALLVRADSVEQRELVREGGYLYWQLFMSAVLVSLYPRPGTLAVVGACFVWWCLASARLHPDPIPTPRAALAVLRTLFLTSETETRALRRSTRPS
jgi:hypothetical protein